MDKAMIQMTTYLWSQSWQIALLVAAVAVATWALRGRSAHVRYLLWLLVVAKCVVPPLFGIAVPILPQDKLAAFAVPMEQSNSIAAGPDAFEEGEMAAAQEPTRSRGDGHPSHSLMPAISRREAMSLLWLAGLAAFLAAASIKAGRTMRRLAKERTALPATLQSDIHELFSSLGIPRLPGVWLVESGSQPFVWGLWRGDIYLPSNFAMLGSSEHQRDILAHELSHVLRFDAAINLLQILAQGVFWFHPLVWWANGKIRQEREKCCDEMAIARLGATPRSYSRAIVEALLVEHKSNGLVPSLAIAGSASDIEERIKAMMTPGKRFHARPGLAAMIAVMSSATLIVPTTITFTARAEAQIAGSNPSSSPGRQTSAGSASGRSAASTAPGLGRVIRFPSDRPVGQLSVQDVGTGRELTSWFHWAGINGLDGTPWEYFCEAQGDIRIPAGKHARLMVNVDSWGDLSWLLKLQPDDLYGLSFVFTDRRVKAGDARLKPVTHLTGLKELVLDNTDITDGGMSMLSSFPSLEELGLNSRVTDRGMVHVAQLTSLKRLYFPMQTKVSSAGLQHISKLTALEELYLGQGIGDAGLAYLRGLPHLTYLCLYGPGFTDTGMVYVKEVPSLRIFSVHENLSRITDAGLVHIAELPNLELLCLHGMRGITDAGIAHLTKMRSLRKLDIGSSRVTDKGLGYLKQIKTLEHLDLPQDQYNISDAGLAHLGELSNLKVLHVSRLHYGGRDRNRIYYTDAGLAQLSKLRSLEELVVGSIGVTDAGMDHIAKLTNLKKLFMFGCEKVTDKGLARLTTLKSLKDLDIAHAKLTIAGLAVLNSMTSLTRLDAGDLERGGAVLNLSGLTNLEDLSLGFRPNSQDAFNDADLACLANLKKLRWLQIGPRNFTDQGMLYLAGLTNIDRLGLGGAGLTDEGFKRLSNLKKLDLLSILGRFDTSIGNWGPGGHITDKGLRYLEAFPRLVFVEIYSDTNFSQEAVQRLWAQSPNLYHLNLNGSNSQPTGIGAK